MRAPRSGTGGERQPSAAHAVGSLKLFPDPPRAARYYSRRGRRDQSSMALLRRLHSLGPERRQRVARSAHRDEWGKVVG